MPWQEAVAAERPAAPRRWRLRLRGSRSFAVGVRLEDAVADTLLRRDVRDWPQQREASALAVDRVLAGGKRHVPAGSTAALPDREPDQLGTGQRAVAEVQLRIGQLSGRVALVVDDDLDGHARGGRVGVRHCLILPGTVMWWFLHRDEEPHERVQWRMRGGSAC